MTPVEEPAAETIQDISWEELRSARLEKEPAAASAEPTPAAEPTAGAPPATEAEPTPAEPAPANEAEQTEEEKQAAAEAAEAAKGAKKKKSIQQRISELTAEKYRSAQERAELERELEELRKKVAPADPGPATAAPAGEAKPAKPVRPDPEKFDGTSDEFVQAYAKYEADLDKWADSVAEWESRRKLEESRAAAEKADREKAQKTLNDSWSARYSAAAEANPDVIDAVNELGGLISSKLMADTIMESEIGPEIVLHMHENPEVLEAFKATTNTTQAARLIGRVEAQILSVKSQKQTPATKPPAPPLPKPPVAVGTGGTPVDVDLEKCDFATYKKLTAKTR
jgi:hypothetical protein